jgi:hypothetical protein
MSSASAFPPLPPPQPPPPPPPHLPPHISTLPYPFSPYPYPGLQQYPPISPLGWPPYPILHPQHTEHLIPAILPTPPRTHIPPPQIPISPTHHPPSPPPPPHPQPTPQQIPQKPAPLKQPQKPAHPNQPKPTQNPITIENKSFKITLVAGRAYPLCITESKFKKPLGNLWLKNKDMQWLSDTIDKVVQYRTRGDFFKHRRDGYKAIHVIRRSNQHGLFLDVSEFHSGSRQSVIRIPAGEERKGWVNFSLMCKGYWEATQTAQGNSHNETQDSRMGAAGKSNSRWASKGKEPQSKLKFENSANVGVNAALGIMMKDTNGKHACLANSDCPLVNARVGLTINMELVCGPGGSWEVAWTKVTHSKVINSTAQTHTHTQARDPSSSKQVWRPKATPPVDRVNPQTRAIRIF